jgi:Bacterial membrane protein YfhO
MGTHGLPLALLGLMVGVFYAPQLAGGTIQWDGVDVHYSAQRYLADDVRAGQLPFWTPYLFSGFPFLADPQVGAWYPPHWPFFLAGLPPASISGELLLHGLIACGGAYALGLRLLGRPLAAVAVALFYGLSGYFAAHSQHVAMVETAAWLPWLLLVLDRLGEALSAPRLALAGLLGAALALPGHFQTALYAVTGAAAWALLEAAAAPIRTPGSASRRQPSGPSGTLRANPVWRRDLAGRAGRVAVGLLVVGVWGALLSAIMILPGLELVGQSLRPRLDGSAIGIGYFEPEALLTLVQPDHYGLLSDAYVGPHDRTQHYFYAGLALVPLALLGLGQARPRRWALLLAVPFLWYALGPVGYLYRAVSRLPGFHSVELPMNGWFLPALGLAILGGAGFRVVETRLRRPWLAIALLALMFVDVFEFNQLLNPLAYARSSFDALYGAPLRAFAAELQAAGPVERLYGPPTTAIGYRNHPLQSRVPTTYGYNPLELAAYADYADAAESNPRLVDGLAATHRLAGSGAGEAKVEPNPSALPFASFARRATALSDEATAVERLAGLDPAEETLVVGALPDVRPDPDAWATVVERGDDRLTVHYRSAGPNLLRLALPAFPGWHARLDGTELATLTVDHALLGVVVPAGEGDLRLWYAPRWFWPGAVTSALALVGALAVLGVAVWDTLRCHGRARS